MATATSASPEATHARVLVVDDDARLRKTLEINLRARGYTADLAGTGEAALQLAASHHPDVIILDLGLPGMDGLEVIAGIRGWSNVPIVVLSGRETEAMKVRALDLGADDYLTKPFGMDELFARLRAASRRAVLPEGDPVLTTADFSIDFAAKRVMREGEPVRLTPRQWHIVEVLVRNQDRLVSYEQLLQEVWGPGYRTETNYLRVFMTQIRQRLEPEPPSPRYFLTEPGMGYRFENAGTETSGRSQDPASTDPETHDPVR
ncbi:response regulator transcription factor [Aeromicrobium sp. CTD01-1L150]|uniref:response regulator transcription factor n=1 Tax=Aeromicrobium sp. CTD01-1L150 TaxID=3341830 RepID=UPI0035C26897